MLTPTGRVPFSGCVARSEPAFLPLPPAHRGPFPAPGPRRVPAPASCRENPAPAGHPAPAGAAAPATTPRTPPSRAPWRSQPPPLPRRTASTSASGSLPSRPGTALAQPSSGGRGRRPGLRRVESQHLPSECGRRRPGQSGGGAFPRPAGTSARGTLPRFSLSPPVGGRGQHSTACWPKESEAGGSGQKCTPAPAPQVNGNAK